MNGAGVGFAPEGSGQQPDDPRREEDAVTHASDAREQQPSAWYDDVDEAALTALSIMVDEWRTDEPRQLPTPIARNYASLVDHCIARGWFKREPRVPRVPSQKVPRWAIMMRGQLWEMSLTKLGEREFFTYWARRRERHAAHPNG